MNPFPQSVFIRSSDNDGRSLLQLAKLLDLDSAELSLWENGRPPGYDYHSFSVKKRSGQDRYLDAPNDELKEIQRRVYNHLLRDEAIQSVAKGFVKGRSIIDNAVPHLEPSILVKIDLKNFFGSIESSKVLRYWAGDGWSSLCSKVLTEICCKNGRLPQGAPTSPALCNVTNRRLDEFLRQIAGRFRASYTRYADDLTFSFRQSDLQAESSYKLLIAEVLGRIRLEGYRVQWLKGIKVLRPHQRQVVTGLVVNKRVKLPRPTRKLIRALQHKRSLGHLSDLDLQRLHGYENLALMLEKHQDLATTTPELLDMVEATSEELSRFQNLGLEKQVSESTKLELIDPAIDSKIEIFVSNDVSPANTIHVLDSSDLTSEDDLQELISKLYDYSERIYYFFSPLGSSSMFLDRAEEENKILKGQVELHFYPHPQKFHHYIYIDPNKARSTWEDNLLANSVMHQRTQLRLSQKAIRDLQIKETVAAQKDADANPLQLKPAIWGVGIDLPKAWKWVRKLIAKFRQSTKNKH